jgi:hypothetical protein
MYSPEEVEFLLEEYEKHGDVQKLATALNKSPRSIIGKLSRLRVYQKKEYLNKAGSMPITKLEYRDRIQSKIGCQLEGLEKAPKSVLEKICSFLEA